MKSTKIQQIIEALQGMSEADLDALAALVPPPAETDPPRRTASGTQPAVRGPGRPPGGLSPAMARQARDIAERARKRAHAAAENARRAETAADRAEEYAREIQAILQRRAG